MSVNSAVDLKLGAIALMTLMTISRFDHLSNALALPDASLAVFFLAGFCYRSSYFLLFLLFMLAGLIDYLAISKLGISDYSISPAYAFLLPTYASVWLTGRHCGNQKLQSFFNYMYITAWLITITGFAFFLSNSSFFLLSGHVTDNGWAHYADTWQRYFPHYLNTTVLYVGTVWAISSFFKAFSPLLSTFNTPQSN